jgi:hypothetical protein
LFIHQYTYPIDWKQTDFMRKNGCLVCGMDPYHKMYDDAHFPNGKTTKSIKMGHDSCKECGLSLHFHSTQQCNDPSLYSFGFECTNKISLSVFACISNLGRELEPVKDGISHQRNLLENVVTNAFQKATVKRPNDRHSNTFSFKMSTNQDPNCPNYITWQTFIRLYDNDKKMHNWVGVYYVLLDHFNSLYPPSSSSPSPSDESLLPLATRFTHS